MLVEETGKNLIFWRNLKKLRLNCINPVEIYGEFFNDHQMGLETLEMQEM